MRRLLTAVMGMMGLALAGAASPASATAFVIDFTGNTPVEGTTTFRDFSDTEYGQTLKVRASAWTINGSKIYNSYLGSYANGLGVTSDPEDGSNLTHVIDNQTEKDFVLLQFSAPVLLTAVTTSAYKLGSVADADFTIGYGNVGFNWNTTINLEGANASTLNTLLKQTPISSSGGTRNLTGGQASNLWLVAASLTNPDGKIDGFKLTSVGVASVVPEPATWMMMILGFGLVGAAIRRRPAAVRAEA